MKIYMIVPLTLVAALLVALLAALVPTYWQTVIIIFVINIILVMSYRLITTMGGWSFAHISILGLGAYTMAILMTGEAGWPFWAAALASIVVTSIFSLALAGPVLRTRAYYFFLSTFAASEALRQCFIQFSSLTGGTNGIAFVPRPAPILGVSFDTNMGFLALTLVVASIVTIGLFLVDRSRLGRTIKAVAANEELSISLGVNAWGYRTFAFVSGSAVAGFAGALLGNFNGAINPSDFSAIAMFKLVAAAIVGGTTTFLGPVLGLLYLTILEEAFRDHASWIPLLWGISVLAAILLTKGGIETLLPASIGGARRATYVKKTNEAANA